jgi:DNA-binding NarL/FixJ family response regulator
MSGEGKGEGGDLDDVRAFRFEHHGEDLYVLSAPIDSPCAASLTRAELEVARAMVCGATNREIAQMRGTSPRTVANQVASILRRLGAKSRVDAALKLAIADPQATAPASSKLRD